MVDGLEHHEKRAAAVRIVRHVEGAVVHAVLRRDGERLDARCRGAERRRVPRRRLHPAQRPEQGGAERHADAGGGSSRGDRVERLACGRGQQHGEDIEVVPLPVVRRGGLFQQPAPVVRAAADTVSVHRNQKLQPAAKHRQRRHRLCAQAPALCGCTADLLAAPDDLMDEQDAHRHCASRRG